MSQVDNHIFTLDDIDDESKDDFMSSLHEALIIIEQDLGKLEKDPFDSDTVNSLFRSMHSIKGNCRMCFIEPLSDYAHELEEVVAEVREGRLAFSTLIKIALSMALDQLRIAAEALMETNQLDVTFLEKIALLFSRIHSSPANEAEIAARGVIRLIGGNIDYTTSQKPSHQQANTATLKQETPNEEKPKAQEIEQQVPIEEIVEEPAATPEPTQLSMTETETETETEPESAPLPQIQLVHSTNKPEKGKGKDYKQVETDLNFFKQMAERIDDLMPNGKNRSEEILSFCLQVNQYFPKPIDLYQLTAAVYVHDVGMTFVSDPKTREVPPDQVDDDKGLQKHPDFGYMMLIKMNGWEDAANMVQQHHERIDGTGYPKGLAGDQICEGAKLIAVADRFYSIISQRGDSTYKRALLRAIKDINIHKNTQFDAKIVNMVNQMVRESITKKGT